MLGALITGGLSYLASKEASRNSAEQAKRQMGFQGDKSDTAHQREVADLRAAGLNPILSARGSGASTPGGAMGSVPDYGSSISKGVSSGIQVASAKANIRNTSAVAGQNEVKSELDRRKLAWLDKHPEYHDAYFGGILGKDTGAPNNLIGLITGAASSAVQKGRQAVDKGLDWLHKQGYKKLNSDRPRSNKYIRGTGSFKGGSWKTNRKGQPTFKGSKWKGPR